MRTSLRPKVKAPAGKNCGLGMMHGSMAFSLPVELAAIGIRF